MITFKEYLTEVLSKQQALKKLGRMMRKHAVKDHGVAGHKTQLPTQAWIKNKPHFSPGPKYDYADMDHAYADNLNAKKIKAKGVFKLERVPIHKIVTKQERVSAKVVAKKTQGTWKEKNIPRLSTFVHNAATGEYELTDGNHRAVKRANQEFTHMWGLVHHPKQDQ